MKKTHQDNLKHAIETHEEEESSATKEAMELLKKHGYSIVKKS